MARIRNHPFKQIPMHEQELPKYIKEVFRSIPIITNYFNISIEDIFKETRQLKISFPGQISQYHFIEENIKLFEQQCWD